MLSTIARRAAKASKPKPVKTLPEGFIPRAPSVPPPPPPRPAANAATDDAGVHVGLRAPRTDRTRSVVDSFRSLPSNTRIIIGVALGICGFAGLWYDRQVGDEDEVDGVEEKSKLPISLRVVDRKE